jgi:hypothetical protein
MSAHDLKVLLDQVPDTRELIVRRLHFNAEHAAWRDAHEEAGAAYVTWRARRTRDSYAAYRAAQDREDAAQDILAGAR